MFNPWLKRPRWFSVRDEATREQCLETSFGGNTVQCGRMLLASGLGCWKHPPRWPQEQRIVGPRVSPCQPGSPDLQRACTASSHRKCQHHKGVSSLRQDAQVSVTEWPRKMSCAVISHSFLTVDFIFSFWCVCWCPCVCVHVEVRGQSLTTSLGMLSTWVYIFKNYIYVLYYVCVLFLYI